MTKPVRLRSFLAIATLLCILFLQNINLSIEQQNKYEQHSFLHRVQHPPAYIVETDSRNSVGHKHVFCAPPPYSCW